MIRVPSFPSSTVEKRTAFYWGAFVFVLVLYHISIVSTFGDDVGFATRLDRYPSLLDYLSMRYSTWSSRLVCDALSVILTRHVLLWKTANIAVYLLLAYALYRLSGKSKSSLFVVLALLLIFRTRDLSSAGWIATNVFYLWPAAFGLFSLIIPYKLAEGERVRWPEVALCVPATVIGANTEQWSMIQIAMLTQFLGIAISRRYTKKTQCTSIFAGLYVTLFACLATILLSPGNYIRAAKEVVVHMKDFYEKNLLDQVIDGFERTMSLLLSSNNAVFFVFAVIIFACVAKKTKDVLYRVTAGIPLVATAAVYLGRVDRNGFFGTFANVITSNRGVAADTWSQLSSYLPIALYILVAVSVVAAFFIIFDDMIKAVAAGVVFTIAIASGTMMGLSPTLFASNVRTLVPCYVLLILLAACVIGHVGDGFSEKEQRCGKYTLTVLCALVVMNNICSI